MVYKIKTTYDSAKGVGIESESGIRSKDSQARQAAFQLSNNWRCPVEVKDNRDGKLEICLCFDELK